MKIKTRTKTKTYQRGGGGKTGRGETHVQSPRVPEVRRCEVFKINMIGMFKMFKIFFINFLLGRFNDKLLMQFIEFSTKLTK